MKKKIPKHPICLTENECATTYGVECFRTSPGAKDSETIVDCNRRFLFMSFRKRGVFLGSKFDFSLLIESLLLAFESYSLTTVSPSYSVKLIQGLLESPNMECLLKNQIFGLRQKTGEQGQALKGVFSTEAGICFNCV